MQYDEFFNGISNSTINVQVFFIILRVLKGHSV